MSVEDVSDDEVGPPANVPIEMVMVHDNDQDSREEFLRNPTYLEA